MSTQPPLGSESVGIIGAVKYGTAIAQLALNAAADHHMPQVWGSSDQVT